MKALPTAARYPHAKLKTKKAVIEKLDRYNQFGLARLVGKEDPEVFAKMAGDVVGDRHVRRRTQIELA